MHRRLVLVLRSPCCWVVRGALGMLHVVILCWLSVRAWAPIYRELCIFDSGWPGAQERKAFKLTFAARARGR